MPLRMFQGSFLLALLFVLPANATSSDVLTPEALAARSDRVVRARVIAQSQEAGSPRFGVQTVSTLQVLEVLIGDPATTLQVVQLGGSEGAERTGVVGDARIARGDEAVWFLRCRDPKAPSRCTLVGLAAGRLPWNAGTGQVQLGAAHGFSAQSTMSLAALRKRLRAGVSK